MWVKLRATEDFGEVMLKLEHVRLVTRDEDGGVGMVWLKDIDDGTEIDASQAQSLMSRLEQL